MVIQAGWRWRLKGDAGRGKPVSWGAGQTSGDGKLLGFISHERTSLTELDLAVNAAHGVDNGRCVLSVAIGHWSRPSHAELHAVYA